MIYIITVHIIFLIYTFCFIDLLTRFQVRYFLYQQTNYHIGIKHAIFLSTHHTVIVTKGTNKHKLKIFALS